MRTSKKSTKCYKRAAGIAVNNDYIIIISARRYELQESISDNFEFSVIVDEAVFYEIEIARDKAQMCRATYNVAQLDGYVGR